MISGPMPSPRAKVTAARVWVWFGVSLRSTALGSLAAGSLAVGSLAAVMEECSAFMLGGSWVEGGGRQAECTKFDTRTVFRVLQSI